MSYVVLLFMLMSCIIVSEEVCVCLLIVIWVLLCQVEVRGQDGKLLSAYSFTHLTLQEFLAALRIMTSNDVSDAQLKKR